MGTPVGRIRITAQWLEPIYRQMQRELLAGGYVQADTRPVATTQLGGTQRLGVSARSLQALPRRHGSLTVASALPERFSCRAIVSITIIITKAASPYNC
jgi:hypothetical protein